MLRRSDRACSSIRTGHIRRRADRQPRASCAGRPNERTTGGFERSPHGSSHGEGAACVIEGGRETMLRPLGRPALTLAGLRPRTSEPGVAQASRHSAQPACSVDRHSAHPALGVTDRGARPGRCCRRRAGDFRAASTGPRRPGPRDCPGSRPPDRFRTCRPMVTASSVSSTTGGRSRPLEDLPLAHARSVASTWMVVDSGPTVPARSSRQVANPMPGGRTGARSQVPFSDGSSHRRRPGRPSATPTRRPTMNATRSMLSPAMRHPLAGSPSSAPDGAPMTARKAATCGLSRVSASAGSRSTSVANWIRIPRRR